MNQISLQSKTSYLKILIRLLKDSFVALGWAILLGIPLFIVHMLLLDYENRQ